MNKETKKLFIIGMTIIVMVGGIFAVFNSNTSSPEEKIDTKLLMGENSHSTAKGTYNYKVTIVEFADFQCPACAFMHSVIKNVLSNDENVNLVFRHFPLNQHQNAKLAALASEAAGEQGKFWEMHNLLYERQKAWEENTQALSLFVDYAQELKLDTIQFKKSVEEQKFLDKIMKDSNDGKTIGVSVTPTLFINGRKFNGVLSAAAIREVIDNELK